MTDWPHTFSSALGRWVRRGMVRVWADEAAGGPSADTIEAAARRAHREILARTVAATWREHLVPGDLQLGDAPSLRTAAGGTTITLPLVGVEGFGQPRWPALDDPRWRAAELDRVPLAWVLSDIAMDAAARERVTRELEDSRWNLALALLARDARDRLARRGGAPGDRRWHDPECFVTLGHPWHPMTRTRLGLRPADNLRHAPEQAARGDMVCLDARRDWLRYTEAYEAWSRAVLGSPPAGFLRLPVHPVQARRLRHRLPGWGVDLRPVHGRTVPGDTLLSLRTVRARLPDGTRPHCKLALGVHTTSARRIVSPMSVTNGPRVSALLRTAMAEDAVCRVHVMHEDHTAGLRPDVAGDDARELGVIVRTDPGPDDAWVFAALGERWPGTSDRLVDLACRGYAGATPMRARALLEALLSQLALPSVRLWLRFGIALEVHQQNLRVRVEDGRLAGVSVRDLGGIRIHRPTLESCGLRLAVHPGSFILTDDADEVRDKLGHALLHASLASLVRWLVPLGLRQDEAWNTICRALLAAARRWAAPPSPLSTATTRVERLLAPVQRAKALLAMRLDGRFSDYAYTEVPAPWTSSIFD